MTSKPPDSWIVGGGSSVVWGVDLDINTTIISKSADAVVEFFPTTPAGDPGLLYRNYVPVESNGQYVVSGIVQADSNAIGNDVAVGIGWYDVNQVLISVSYAWQAPVPSINVWHPLEGEFDSPANARYARPFFFKVNNPFTAYLDTLVFNGGSGSSGGRIKFSSYLTVSTPYASGSTIVFDAIDYNLGGYYNPITGLFTAPSLGEYVFNSQCEGSVPSQKYIILGIAVNGLTVAASTRCYAFGGGMVPATVAGSWTLGLSAGDTVRMDIFHNLAPPPGTTLTVKGIAGAYKFTKFSGFKL